MVLKQREIKFRAWDNEKMHKVSFNNLSCNNNYPSGQLILRNEMMPGGKSHETILMQYTGLKDKNGKEIYEGDIIQLETGKDKYFFAPVVYHTENACFDLEHPEGYRGHWGLNFAFIDTCNYEVIGNIYENPDLLK